MGFVIRDREDLEAALRRIAGEQIDLALSSLSETDIHNSIHEIRKCCKRIRGLLRLFRPALGDNYSQENSCFRDAAREFSELRDATSLIECFDALIAHCAAEIDGTRFHGVRQALLARRRDFLETSNLETRLAHFSTTMKAARVRVQKWSLQSDAFEVITRGVAKTYRRALKAMELSAQSPSTTCFHQWRKRVKYHRYHCRLLTRICEPMMGDRRDAVKELSDWLGDDHDLAVLQHTLLTETSRFAQQSEVKATLALAETRRSELQSRSFLLGRRLFTDTPRQFINRIESISTA